MTQYNLSPNTGQVADVLSNQKEVECTECGREVQIDECRDPDEYKCGYCR